MTGWVVPASEVEKVGIGRTSSATGTVSTDCAAYYSGATWGNDQSAQATLAALNGSTEYAGVTVRMSGSGGYGLITDGSGANTIFTIWTGSSVAQLGSSLGVTWVVGDVIKLGIVGTTLTAYKNGTSIGTITDSTFASGAPGVETYGVGAVDDWSATDGVGGGPTINTQPVSATCYVGQTATFTISATTSGGTLHYQWKDDGSNVGTDSNSYTTAAALLSDNGSSITCVVTDNNGSVTSNAAIWTVLPAASVAWLTA